MTMDGEIISGRQKPSSEWPLHQAVYQIRSDVKAVIHAHPAKSTALAAMHQTINVRMIAESIYHLGESVPLVPYVLPGSQALADAVADAAKTGAWVMILANHGALAMGETLEHAYHNLELLESLAEIQLITNQFKDQLHVLSSQDVEAIRQLKVTANTR